MQVEKEITEGERRRAVLCWIVLLNRWPHHREKTTTETLQHRLKTPLKKQPHHTHTDSMVKWQRQGLPVSLSDLRPKSKVNTYSSKWSCTTTKYFTNY